MLSSSEMDTFLAGLSEDWSELYDALVVKNYIDSAVKYSTLEEIHTSLEGYLVDRRKLIGKPYKDPKPYSGEVKSKLTVVYNLWTPADQKLYASLKIA